MTTVAQQIQSDLDTAIAGREAKIQAAVQTATSAVDAEISALQAKLSQADGAFAALLSKDKDEVKAWFHSMAAHLGL